MRLHYAPTGIRISACGILNVRTTSNRAHVTCLRCNPNAPPVIPQKTHLLTSGQRTACGRDNPPLTTRNPDEITCGICGVRNRSCRECGDTYPLSAFRKFGSGRSRLCDSCRVRNRDEHYGDSTFKGTGKYCCRLCGRPYRDHPRPRPCEFTQGMVA